MTVRCLFCQATYKAEPGRSVCPACDRPQQHTSLANFALPASGLGRLMFWVVAIFVLLVLIGWGLNLSR